MSELTGIKFRPVMGPEDLIKNAVQSNGYLYVATDSGNMYLDVNNHRISIGGAGGSGGTTAGFVWADGNEEAIIKVTDDDDDTRYYISTSCLEESVMPKVDNLILNSDGRFFRVLELDLEEDRLITSLIAVSGSGSGGGGGGGSISERDVDITWDSSTIAAGKTYIYK